MRLLVFLVVATCAMVIGYAIGLGGPVVALIFLFILFNGVMDRVMQPLLEKLRP